MNTQAHAILNAVLLQRLWKDAKDRARVLSGVIWGSLVPDLPMVLFFFWYTFTGTSQHLIWDKLYFLPEWQAFFNVFNSIPLALLVLVLAWQKRHKVWMGFSLGLVLHALFDLFLHQEDAHAHFWPLSDWMFHSPVSYWDTANGGAWFGWVEMVATFGCALWLWKYLEKWWSKTLLALAAGSLVLGNLFWMLVF